MFALVFHGVEPLYQQVRVSSRPRQGGVGPVDELRSAFAVLQHVAQVEVPVDDDGGRAVQAPEHLTCQRIQRGQLGAVLLTQIGRDRPPQPLQLRGRLGGCAVSGSRSQ